MHAPMATYKYMWYAHVHNMEGANFILHTIEPISKGLMASARKFDSFAELEWYMEKYWHIMETGDQCIVGHEMGQLTNITYPRGSHHGAATRKQGYRLNSIWEEYNDNYGVFGVSSENCHDYSPLNNAPSNWSTVHCKN